MQEAIKGLAIAIAASVITLVVHGLFESPNVVAAMGSAERGDLGDGRVLAALARLEERLDASESIERPSVASAPAARRPAVDHSTGSASASLDHDEVVARLVAIEAALRARPIVSPDFPTLDRMRAIDVPAIREVIDLRRVDREAAEWDIHLRTMPEIVERFGYPTETGACSGSNCDLFWKYELPSAHPDNRNYFSVYFVGNLVAWFEGRWTD